MPAHLLSEVVGYLMSGRSQVEIAWCAGFADGEGYFGWTSGPLVTISQVDRWPLDKWMESFPNGSIKLRPGKDGQNDFWRWSASGANAIECMLALRDHLSPRRQEKIDQAVAEYLRRQAVREAKKNVCPKGHIGQKRRRSGGVYCAACKKDQNERAYARRRAENEE